MVWRGLLTDLYLYSVDLNPSLPQVGVTGRLQIAIGKPTELPIQKTNPIRSRKYRAAPDIYRETN